MPNIVNDIFMKELGKLKKMGTLKINHLDICGSNITDKSIVFLNVFELISLNISECKKINNLKGLYIPNLSEIYMDGCSLDDDTISDVFNNQSLTHLELDFNFDVTDATLQRLHESKIKLNGLHALGTQITMDGIVKYLSGMRLSSLCFPELLHRTDTPEELLLNNVIIPDPS